MKTIWWLESLCALLKILETHNLRGTKDWSYRFSIAEVRNFKVFEKNCIHIPPPPSNDTEKFSKPPFNVPTLSWPPGPQKIILTTQKRNSVNLKIIITSECNLTEISIMRTAQQRLIHQNANTHSFDKYHLQ